jgi:hypothetical protein
MSDVTGIYPPHKSDEWFRQVYALTHEEFALLIVQYKNINPPPSKREVAIENLCTGYRRMNPTTKIFNTTDGVLPLAVIFDLNPNMSPHALVERLRVSKEEWLQWYFNREPLPQVKARFLRRFSTKWFQMNIVAQFE